MVELAGDQGKLTAVSAVTAIELLSLSHIVTARQWAEHTGETLKESPEIPFTEETLRECALANHQGKADWRLVFCGSRYHLINWAGEFLGLDGRAKLKAINQLASCFQACPKDILHQAFSILKEIRGFESKRSFYYPVSYRQSVNRLDAWVQATGGHGTPPDENELAKDEVVAIWRQPDL